MAVWWASADRACLRRTVVDMKISQLSGNDIGRLIRIQLEGGAGANTITVGTLRAVHHRVRRDGTPETRVIFDAFGGRTRLTVRNPDTDWLVLD